MYLHGKMLFHSYVGLAFIVGIVSLMRCIAHSFKSGFVKLRLNLDVVPLMRWWVIE